MLDTGRSEQWSYAIYERYRPRLCALIVDPNSHRKAAVSVCALQHCDPDLLPLMFWLKIIQDLKVSPHLVFRYIHVFLKGYLISKQTLNLEPQRWDVSSRTLAAED